MEKYIIKKKQKRLNGIKYMFNSFNTPFTENINKKEEVFSNILSVVVHSGRPFISTVVWMNDNFEFIYSSYPTDIEVYEHIFDHFKIKYKQKE